MIGMMKIVSHPALDAEQQGVKDALADAGFIVPFTDLVLPEPTEPDFPVAPTDPTAPEDPTAKSRRRRSTSRRSEPRSQPSSLESLTMSSERETLPRAGLSKV